MLRLGHDVGCEKSTQLLVKYGGDEASEGGGSTTSTTNDAFDEVFAKVVIEVVIHVGVVLLSAHDGKIEYTAHPQRHLLLGNEVVRNTTGLQRTAQVVENATELLHESQTVEFTRGEVQKAVESRLLERADKVREGPHVDVEAALSEKFIYLANDDLNFTQALHVVDFGLALLRTKTSLHHLDRLGERLGNEIGWESTGLTGDESRGVRAREISGPRAPNLKESSKT